MLIASAAQKMLACSGGALHDIDYFLKVWSLARTIGELEGLDRHTQTVLELAALVHDIACPLCREKYGDTNGKHQELESPPLVEPSLRTCPSRAAMWSASRGWSPITTPTQTLTDPTIRSCWRRIFSSTQAKVTTRSR